MKGERLELHRRMAGVVETSWSLGDIDRAAKEMSTPQHPILAGAMEAHMPRGDYWAGLYNAKSTRSPFCARSCAGINKNVWIRACAGPGKYKDLGIAVRGDSE